MIRHPILTTVSITSAMLLCNCTSIGIYISKEAIGNKLREDYYDWENSFKRQREMIAQSEKRYINQFDNHLFGAANNAYLHVHYKYRTEMLDGNQLFFTAQDFANVRSEANSAAIAAVESILNGIKQQEAYRREQQQQQLILDQQVMEEEKERRVQIEREEEKSRRVAADVVVDGITESSMSLVFNGINPELQRLVQGKKSYFFHFFRQPDDSAGCLYNPASILFDYSSSTPRLWLSSKVKIEELVFEYLDIHGDRSSKGVGVPVFVHFGSVFAMSALSALKFAILNDLLGDEMWKYRDEFARAEYAVKLFKNDSEYIVLYATDPPNQGVDPMFYRNVSVKVNGYSEILLASRSVPGFKDFAFIPQPVTNINGDTMAALLIYKFFEIPPPDF